VVTLPASIDAAFEVAEVRAAVAELPDDERQVVRLQYLDGLTQSEVAERLEVPLGTVKSRSFRAYRRLASRLGHLQNGVGANHDEAGNVEDTRKMHR
jgi:RNA polymerase sigma-70 factor (ECF subfamily)